MYRCEFCGKEFSEARALNGHISLAHTKKTTRFTGKGQCLSQEHKEKIAQSEGETKSRWSLERRTQFRQSSSRAAVKRWTNPEYRRRISEQIKQLWFAGHYEQFRERNRQALSEAFRKKWSDPEYRAKVINSLRMFKKDVMAIHDQAILELTELLTKQGCRCIPIGIRVIPQPDIIAVNTNGEIIFYEVQHRDKHKRMVTKYVGFEQLYDKLEIFHVKT